MKRPSDHLSNVTIPAIEQHYGVRVHPTWWHDAVAVGADQVIRGWDQMVTTGEYPSTVPTPERLAIIGQTDDQRAAVTVQINKARAALHAARRQPFITARFRSRHNVIVFFF